MSQLVRKSSYTKPSVTKRCNQLRQNLGPAPLQENEEIGEINEEKSNSISESENLYWLIEENEELMCDHSYAVQSNIFTEHKEDTQFIERTRTCTEPSVRKNANKIYEFDSAQFEEAKQALQDNCAIKYTLPKDVTSKKLLQIAQSFGFNTDKLKHILTSSVIIKKLIDDYVSVYKQKPSYITTEVDYLKFITEVTPLECDRDMNAQVQIKMDLDYYRYAFADRQFKRKFINQMAQNIFKCDTNKIIISGVRRGSIILVLAIGLVTLAHCGVIAIVLHNDRRMSMPRQHFEIDDKVKVNNLYDGTVTGKYRKGEDICVKIRYDGQKPRWFWNQYVFTSDDPNIKPGNGKVRINSELSGAIHINSGEVHVCQNMSYISSNPSIAV